MKLQPVLRVLLCIVFLLAATPRASTATQTPAPEAAGNVLTTTSRAAQSAAPPAIEGNPGGSARLEAMRAGRWPAQLAGSTGAVRPNRYGPQRTDPREGTPAHAYSPFDEKRNREYPCPSGGCEYERGHVLVKFAPGFAVGAAAVSEVMGNFTSDAGVNGTLAALDVKSLRPIFPSARPPKAGAAVEAPDGAAVPLPDLTRWYRADFRATPEDIYAAVEALAATPGIAWAEPDYLRKPVGAPSAQGATELPGRAAAAPAAAFNDPLYGQQWHLGATQVPAAWDWLTTNGYPAGGSRDIIVAVIDTGVDYTHPDLAANMWVNAAEFNGVAGVDDDGNGYVDDIHGADTVTPDGNPVDDHGHGTHVAGIIAAQANNGIGGVGVAYNTQIMALKAAQYSGVLSSSDIAEAIYYAVEKGANVINMSFGGYIQSQTEQEALTVAFATSVLVAAAGNDGLSITTRVMWPAGYTWVLGVMASDRGGPKAGFSNYDNGRGLGYEYEASAPGVDIWSTLPSGRYAAWDGTSMAAPVVSGLAALARTRWDNRDLYSSRFIMGQIASNLLPGTYYVSDALAALTVPPEPSVTYQEHWLFDTPNLGATNDDDGVIDSGETIDLAITLKNHWGKADSVSATLDAWAAGAVQPDPYVTFITDTVDYGAIGSFNQDDNGLIRDGEGVIIGVAHPYRFILSSATPNDHIIPMRLRITARNGLDPDDETVYLAESRFSLIVQRGRELPRVISHDMTLTQDDYWIVPDATLIEAGVTVTVTEGTQIQFFTADPSSPYASSGRPRLQVEGNLLINGSESQPVELFPTKLHPGSPVEILNPGSGRVELRFARVMNPRVGVLSWTYDNVSCSACKALSLIDHSYFAQEVPYCMRGQWGGFDGCIRPFIHAYRVTNSIIHKIGGYDYTYEVYADEEHVQNLFDSVSGFERSSKVTNTVFLLNRKEIDTNAGSILQAPSIGYQCTTCDPAVARTSNPFHNNAILNAWWEPSSSAWMYINAGTGRSTSYYLTDNYWGTTSDVLIDASIYDYQDNFNLGKYVWNPALTVPPSETYPFLATLRLSTASTEDAAIVGAETVTFTLTFNRDMDPAVQPMVSFGPDVPLTDYTIHPIAGGWYDARVWRGTFDVTPLTGDGYQLVRVAGAVAADDPWLVTGDDAGRFRFEIITSGTEAMNLQATGGEGYVDLMWAQDDFDLLAGYNLYRSNSRDGTYSRINQTIIPLDQKTWRDPNVTPGVPYYYYFKVVKSDMSESGPSNIAEGTPIDTIAPTIAHMPITSATYGMGLSVPADVTDNVGVQGATLFYRALGTTPYTSLAMTRTTGDRYSATIPGSAVVAPGIEYYIEATDGITPSRHGTYASPHPVTVTDKPTVISVTPNQGATAGGTSVTIAGSNFQSGASVTFGGAPASGVVVQSGSQITCQTPAHYAAVVDVTVTNPSGGAGTLLNGYTYASNATTLALPDAAGGQNTSVEVPVNAANVAGLVAASFTVTFDPSVLTPTGAIKGNLTPSWTLSVNTGTPGQIRLALASGGGSVTGSGVLAHLQFDVVGAPAAATALTFANVLLNDGAIPAETQPGSFQVHQVYSVSGATRFWNGGAGVPGATLTLSGERVYTSSSDAAGAYTVGGAAAGDYTLAPAKSDGAGEITAYDASLALQHDSGVASLSGHAFKAADVNRTGAVTAMDAHYILQQSVDLIGLPFPGAGIVWDFDPASRSYTGLSANLTGQDFTAILLGDISGNWTAAAGAAAAMSGASRVESQSAGLALPEVISAPGGDSILDLVLQDNTGAVQGVDLTLTYDPAIVEFVAAALGNVPGDWTLAQNETTAGTVKLGLAGATPVSDDRVLARVTFSAIGTKGEVSAISFARSDLNEGQVSASASAGQILIDTPPVLDLAVSLESGPPSNPVTLEWSGVGSDAHHYEVWRAFGAPYFTPEAGGVRIADAIVPATTLSYTDPDGQAASPGTAVFYLVRAVDANGRPSPAYNRVGVMVFELEPGTIQ